MLGTAGRAAGVYARAPPDWRRRAAAREARDAATALRRRARDCAAARSAPCGAVPPGDPPAVWQGGGPRAGTHWQRPAGVRGQMHAISSTSLSGRLASSGLPAGAPPSSPSLSAVLLACFYGLNSGLAGPPRPPAPIVTPTRALPSRTRTPRRIPANSDCRHIATVHSATEPISSGWTTTLKLRLAAAESSE